MPWPVPHRGDFLNKPFKGTLSGYWSGRKYYKASHKVRAQYRAALLADGYTRIYFDLFGQWGNKDSYFDHPKDLLPFLQEAAADGLGPVVFLGPEDDKPAQAKWPPHKFIVQLRKFITICGPCIAECVLGVEVEEYWSDDDVSTIGKALRQWFSGPIWVHRSTGEHGPWAWWKQQTWATGLAYQFNKRDKKNGGFLAHPADVRAETALYAGRLKTHGGGKQLLAGEYAWKRPEAKGRALGQEALTAGAVGAMNGV